MRHSDATASPLNDAQQPLRDVECHVRGAVVAAASQHEGLSRSAVVATLGLAPQTVSDWVNADARRSPVKEFNHDAAAIVALEKIPADGHIIAFGYEHTIIGVPGNLASRDPRIFAYSERDAAAEWRRIQPATFHRDV